MIYDLPTSVCVNGTEYDIRSDYRAILDIITAMCDAELSDGGKGKVALDIFYIDFDKIPSCDYQEALNQCIWFINKGKEQKQVKREPILMSWEQDFDLIISPINRIAGCEVRELKYLHWWTFLSYYQEIGECLFAQVVAIRDKRSHGKQLEKHEREFYRRNRDIIDLKTKITQRESQLLAELGIK